MGLVEFPARHEGDEVDLCGKLGRPAGEMWDSHAAGVADGQEAALEDRLGWVGEVGRTGARVELADAHHATITGPSRLIGAEVEIGDLRAGASLMLAALAADGTTTIHGAHHVHRGYENIEGKFTDIGASISRRAEGTADTTS